jgi:hypothetical protein
MRTQRRIIPSGIGLRCRSRSIHICDSVDDAWHKSILACQSCKGVVVYSFKQTAHLLLCNPIGSCRLAYSFAPIQIGALLNPPSFKKMLVASLQNGGNHG